MIPNLALADGGIPIFFMVGVWQVIVFALVVLVEFIYLFKKLSKLTKSKVFKGTLLANLFSTFIGYFCLFIARLPFYGCIFCGSNKTINNILNIFNDPLLIAIYSHGNDSYCDKFIVHISFIVLLLSCFIMSWLFEYRLFYRIQKDNYTKKEISHAMFAANVISYGLFFVTPILVTFLYNYYLR